MGGSGQHFPPSGRTYRQGYESTFRQPGLCSYPLTTVIIMICCTIHLQIQNPTHVPGLVFGSEVKKKKKP